MGEAARAVTSRTIYVRFHGATSKYAGRYRDRVLDEWAAFLQPHLEAGCRVYVYFNNDVDAQAPVDAQRLRERLSAWVPTRAGSQSPAAG